VLFDQIAAGKFFNELAWEQQDITHLQPLSATVCRNMPVNAPQMMLTQVAAVRAKSRGMPDYTISDL
jgi:hypothetical protein